MTDTTHCTESQGNATVALRTTPILRIVNHRKHERLVRAFPFWLINPSGHAVARFYTENISNAGCYGSSDHAPELPVGQNFLIEIKIPRQTENTYMLENVRIPVTIVRSERTISYSRDALAIALKFAAPLELDID